MIHQNSYFMNTINYLLQFLFFEEFGATQSCAAAILSCTKLSGRDFWTMSLSIDIISYASYLMHRDFGGTKPNHEKSVKSVACSKPVCEIIGIAADN